MGTHERSGGASLPPLLADYAAALAVLPTLTLDDATLADARPLMADEATPNLPDGVTYRDLTTTGADGHKIVLRCYERSDPGHAPASQRPALLWIHGGGYVMGSYRNDTDLIGPLVRETGAVVVSVEYRLAPEHPYPIPLEDCYASLAALHQRAGELGIDPSRIGIAGLSAGGGLAAGLALLARERGELPVALCVLDSPMLDDRQITQSSQHDDLPLWTKASNTYGWRSYLGELWGNDEVPPTAAPARCTDLSGLPPTFIAVGAVDGFRDEDVDYATRIAQAGGTCELHVYAGTPHGFRIFGEIGVGAQSIVDIVRFVTRHSA